MDNDYYLRILFMSCVYYLCAAGVNVLVGYAGQKSLGQAGLFAAGATRGAADLALAGGSLAGAGGRWSRACSAC